MSELQSPIKFKFNLICVSKCKKYALEHSDKTRAKKFNRVSEEFLISCEAALKQHIQSRVQSHPSIGKTLK
jgi:hypothetical protein